LSTRDDTHPFLVRAIRIAGFEGVEFEIDPVFARHGIEGLTPGMPQFNALRSNLTGGDALGQMAAYPSS